LLHGVVATAALLIAKRQLKRVLPADNPHNEEQHNQDEDQQKQRDQLFHGMADLSAPKARSSGLELNRRQEAQLDQGYFRVGISIMRSRSNIPLRLSQTGHSPRKWPFFVCNTAVRTCRLQRPPS
jgi:hypothetical protein